MQLIEKPAVNGVRMYVDAVSEVEIIGSPVRGWTVQRRDHAMRPIVLGDFWTFAGAVRKIQTLEV